MLRVKKINGLEELNTFLRGGILGGKKFEGSALYGLHGLTLVFTSPAASTVTFATPGSSSQEALSLKDVVAQINAVVAGIARMHDGRLLLQHSSTKITITGASTALTALGFDATGVTGTVYAAPGGAAPALVSASNNGPNMNAYLVVTNE